MKRVNSYAVYAVAVHGILPISKPFQVIPAESTSVSRYSRRSTPATRTELLSAKQKRHAIEFDDLRRWRTQKRDIRGTDSGDFPAG